MGGQWIAARFERFSSAQPGKRSQKSAGGDGAGINNLNECMET
jgi:hypothetical protein